LGVVQVTDRLVRDLSPDGTASAATHLEGDDLADPRLTVPLVRPHRTRNGAGKPTTRL
jgi:hypothetical protein